MFGTKENTTVQLTAEEWARKANEEVPGKGRFAVADRGEKLAYANYCATMAVYEQMLELTKLMTK